MKQGGWIPVDKRLISLLPKDRPYTFIEAYLSLRVDIENEHEGTINGYANLWGWSRNKVRNFVEGLRTGKGHSVDNQRTGKGQELRIIFNNLDEAKDRQRTGKGQSKDRQEDTTINPNPNPNPKDISCTSSEAQWIAVEMGRLILTNHPQNRELQPAKYDTTIYRWGIDIDRMIRIDQRPPRQIVEVLRWSQQDTFWQANILSAKKLRDKFDQLVAQMGRGGAPRKGQGLLEQNIQAGRDAAELLGVFHEQV